MVITENSKRISAALDAMGITMTAEFVPYSRSRNAVPGARAKDMGLNWKVTILRNGREVLTTDYGAGIAHCPSYKQGAIWTIVYDEAIRHECETGKTANLRFGSSARVPILPSREDVLYSLTLDGDVLDHRTFEDWADSFGYGADSREAEAIYRACLDIALKMRAALGEVGITALRELFQDY